MTFTLLDVIHTVQIARQAAPSARIILGGPHVYLFPRESVALPGVDFALPGEGEYSFLGLCNRLGQPERWSEVPGLVYRRPSRGFPDPREVTADIASRGRGSPREGSFSSSRGFRPAGGYSRQAPVLTSRGRRSPREVDYSRIRTSPSSRRGRTTEKASSDRVMVSSFSSANRNGSIVSTVWKRVKAR
jgi:hypothetical protein